MSPHIGTMNLYPESAVPMALGNAPEDIPEITLYSPETVSGTPVPAILVCPGGGYGCLCSTYEGTGIAQWLNSFGFAAIVLKYRIRPYRHPVPLMDAQRALRTVRVNAASWNLDADRIGIMGFSAGGHLAAMAAVHGDNGNPESEDPIERESSRPDFQVLIYPVITFVQPHASMGTQLNLIGENAPEDLRMFLSVQLQVTDHTPRAFVAHSVKDQVVDVENARMFVQAMKNHSRPVEYYELSEGLHGLGCGVGEQWAAWQEQCRKWLLTL